MIGAMQLNTMCILFQKRLTVLKFMRGLIVPHLLLVLTGCYRDEIPTELKLDTVLYDSSEKSVFGPAGLTKGLVAYQMENDVLQQIESKGLAFLNSMPSALSYEPIVSKPGYEGSIDRFSFTQWRPLPIPQSEHWNWNSSYPKTNKALPVLADYFGDQPHLSGANPPRNFSEKIDPQIRDEFHQLIHGAAGYYSYGGFRRSEIIVVSPAQMKIYHLFRG